MAPTATSEPAIHRSGRGTTDHGPLHGGISNPAQARPTSDVPPLLAEAKERFVELERQRRRIEAEMSQLVQAVDRSGVYRQDGHGSASAWCRAEGRWASREATLRLRTGALLHGIPACAEAMAAGHLGVAQAQELARAYRNPRCGHLLADVMDVFLEVADVVSYDEFVILVRRWENLADVDGAHARAERAYARRNASVVTTMDGVHIDAHGPAINGALMAEVFARYCDAEFALDWEEARQEKGDDATRADLPRTPGQRHFDALCKVFEIAGTCAPGIRPGEPIVNIHVDEQTLNETLDAVANPEDTHCCRGPIDVFTRRCETADGVPLAPTEVLAATIAGQVRRLLRSRNGVTLEFGRRRRLFTGAAREAVLLSQSHCVWPGCNVPSSRCQVDHLTEWRDDGTTDVANAVPLCGRHNRFKSHGYRLWRDDGGQWHTFRPDGTKIG
jgi:hypothetical protein